VTQKLKRVSNNESYSLNEWLNRPHSWFDSLGKNKSLSPAGNQFIILDHLACSIVTLTATLRRRFVIATCQFSVNVSNRYISRRSTKPDEYLECEYI
jgi:hypothetical protein